VGRTGSYIKLDRGLKNNSLWTEKPFSKGQAWVDLLMLAQGVEKRREYRGKRQVMHRGCVYTSIYFLSDRWGWSRMKVYRFLEKLMIDEMIVVQGWRTDETTNRTVHRTTNETKSKTTDETTISIVNWALYQYSETTDDTKHRPVRSSADETTNETHKRKKEKDTEIERKKPPKSPKGDNSPSDDNDGEFYDSPNGRVKRGTDEFRKVSHLILSEEEGTADDIPMRYREQFNNNFAEYKRFRNQ